MQQYLGMIPGLAAAVLIFGGLHTSPALAMATCQNGAVVKDTKYCDFIVTFKKRGTVAVDPRIERYIPRTSDSDPEVRSIAIIVAVESYPNYAAQPVLQSVKNDIPLIKRFLDQQGFDEVIFLTDGQATKDNIKYFLDEYLMNRLTTYRQRSRLLFMFDGHGLPGVTAQLPGALALSAITSTNDTDPSDSYQLQDLQGELQRLGALAYQSIALIGACYSGGLFPLNTAAGTSFIYPRAPGAHALTAAKSDELAYGMSDDEGTIFFDRLNSVIENSKESPNETVFASFADGQTTKIDGSIIRLGDVYNEMNESLEDLKNPETGSLYPQVQIGSLASDPSYQGAFFFLKPLPSQIALNDINQTIRNNIGEIANVPHTEALSLPQTGSAIVGHPEIKIFSFPEAYQVHGIDVSHFNGKPRFDRVPKGMISFVYAKVSEGKTYHDPTFADNVKAAKAAGLKVGAYHVFSPCVSADDQYANLTRSLSVDPNLLPITIDLNWHEMSDKDNACENIDTVRANLKDFAQRVAQHYGKSPVIHTGKAGVDDILKADFNTYPLWYRNLGQDPSYQGNNPWSFWQYQDDAKLPGMDGAVDVNVFFGTPEEFNTFASQGSNTALLAATSVNLPDAIAAKASDTSVSTAPAVSKAINAATKILLPNF